MNLSLTRGLRILDLLVAEQRPWRLNEIALSLDSSRSGLHALLATLVECGYVERLPGGFYQLGFKSWRIGTSFPTADLLRAAAPVMDTLVKQVREGCVLGVLDGFDVSYMQVVESSQAVGVNARVGERFPAHCTSTGLAILAFQTEMFLDRLIPASLPARSSKTITDPGELRAELHRIRARGYAINRGGWHEDVGGIAVPVMGSKGPIAGLCIALPLFRMTPDWLRRAAPLLMQAAAEIENTIGTEAAEHRVSK